MAGSNEVLAVELLPDAKEEDAPGACSSSWGSIEGGRSEWSGLNRRAARSGMDATKGGHGHPQWASP